MKRPIHILCVVFTALVPPTAETGNAAEHHVRLFESGKEGYRRYRIPSLVVMNSGTLLAVCEGRRDGGGLTGNVDLVAKRSRDNGKTWGPLIPVADMNHDTVGNQAVLVDPVTGTIWIAHTISPGNESEAAITRGESERSTRVYVTHSRDEGKTWSRPRDITATAKRPGWSWYGCGPGVGLTLKSGRLYFPCYHAEGNQGETYRSHAIFSDDHGKSWHLGGNAGQGNGESQALQRGDGTLYLNARTSGKGPQVRTILESRDEGQTWSTKAVDRTLYDPPCQASLLRLARPHTKPQWLFCHPAGPGRRQLTLRLSRNEGRSWDAGSLRLKDGDSQYSSLARLANGRIGILYDCWKANNYQLFFTTVSLADVK